MEGSRERSDAERGQTRPGSCGRGADRATTSYLIRYSLEPLWCQLACRFLSHSLSLSLSPTLASTLVRPPVRVFEDLRGRLVRVSGSLSSLWAAIADRSHASRRTSSASLRPLSCARLSHPYLYGHKLATVDLLTLRHGAIFSPPVPPACPDSAYIHPGFT